MLCTFVATKLNQHENNLHITFVHSIYILSIGAVHAYWNGS